MRSRWTAVLVLLLTVGGAVAAFARVTPRAAPGGVTAIEALRRTVRTLGTGRTLIASCLRRALRRRG